MAHATAPTELGREKNKRRHEEKEDPTRSPKNLKTAGGGAALPGSGACGEARRPCEANQERTRCSTPPAECAPTSPPKRPPLGRAPELLRCAGSAASAAGSGDECGKPETPYHPICLGFFGKESPVPDRPLAQAVFPKCLSPVLRRPPVSLQALRRQVVEQEQAELMELFHEAESEGAVALTGTSMLFPPPGF
jgi:hypothetical protein